MSNVYIIEGDGRSTPLERVRCKDEDLELQRILDLNHDLLPGEQINPEDPRRWLLIKREMPVPDPSSGSDRWSVDFFFVDQDAMPTFVECKRFEDTRSRREVVGQMFEYAANGHYYWTKEAMIEFAEEAAKARGKSLDDALTALGPESDDSVDTFFDRVQNNLREGQVRIVFFLEESPMELRSLVDFLNRQMERSEILLVEARLYERDGLRVVVPTLFGYTEQARRVKKTVTVSSRAGQAWNEASFFADARERLDDQQVGAIQSLYDFCQRSASNIRWGRGAHTGSFMAVWTGICPKPLLYVNSDGSITPGFDNVRDGREGFRERYLDLFLDELGINLPDGRESNWPTIGVDEWAGKSERLVSGLNQLFDEFTQT